MNWCCRICRRRNVWLVAWIALGCVEPGAAISQPTAETTETDFLEVYLQVDGEGQWEAMQALRAASWEGDPERADVFSLRIAGALEDGISVERQRFLLQRLQDLARPSVFDKLAGYYGSLAADSALRGPCVAALIRCGGAERAVGFLGKSGDVQGVERARHYLATLHPDPSPVFLPGARFAGSRELRRKLVAGEVEESGLLEAIREPETLPVVLAHVLESGIRLSPKLLDAALSMEVGSELVESLQLRVVCDQAGREHWALVVGALRDGSPNLSATVGRAVQGSTMDGLDDWIRDGLTDGGDGFSRDDAILLAGYRGLEDLAPELIALAGRTGDDGMYGRIMDSLSRMGGASVVDFLAGQVVAQAGTPRERIAQRAFVDLMGRNPRGDAAVERFRAELEDVDPGSDAVLSILKVLFAVPGVGSEEILAGFWTGVEDAGVHQAVLASLARWPGNEVNNRLLHWHIQYPDHPASTGLLEVLDRRIQTMLKSPPLRWKALEWVKSAAKQDPDPALRTMLLELRDDFPEDMRKHFPKIEPVTGTEG